MHKAIKYVFVWFAIFALLSTAIYTYLLSFPKSADEQRIAEYARTYLREYEDLVQIYGSELANLSQFSFYSGYPYRVLGVVSEVHGAAVFFDSSTTQIVETISTPERIEFYLWPAMKQYSSDTFWQREYAQGNGFETYIISANLQIGDGETPTYFYVGQKTAATFSDNYTITVMPLGRFRIDGILRYENRMNLKGSKGRKILVTRDCSD